MPWARRILWKSESGLMMLESFAEHTEKKRRVEGRVSKGRGLVVVAFVKGGNKADALFFL